MTHVVQNHGPFASNLVWKKSNIKEGQYHDHCSREQRYSCQKPSTRRWKPLISNPSSDNTLLIDFNLKTRR